MGTGSGSQAWGEGGVGMALGETGSESESESAASFWKSMEPFLLVRRRGGRPFGLIFGASLPKTSGESGSPASGRRGVKLRPLPLSDGDLRNVVQHFFNSSATDSILAYYRRSSLASDAVTRAARASETEAPEAHGNVAIASAITTDYFWYCAARRLARTASKHQARTFQYFFDFPLRWTGDCHGCEMPFVWDYQPRGRAFTPAEASLSHDLMQYWLAFAKSGGDPNDAPPRVAPNAPERPVWPRFQEGSEAVMEFNTTRRVLTGGFQKELCDFWQGYHLAHPTSKTGMANVR